ncbi:MAG TPA: hypothetical protein VGP84_19220, partial [Gemmatimonadaceae bacterium]|nr:hypothetical protein [Gemmatimonadaceae bacterium]
VLYNQGELRRANELHIQALEIALALGYEESIRWLSTEIAIDHEVAGEWDEAREMVDELIPGYAQSPFWIEPQTRVCRARMLIAGGDIAAAVVDAERAIELTREGRGFQNLCDPRGFRARLHAELGEANDAQRSVVDLMDAWLESRSAYLGQWLLEAWYAGWHSDEEARVVAATELMPPNPWVAVTASMAGRDFVSAANRLDEMGAVSSAALARLWASEWLVESGRRAEAADFLEQSLRFWRSVGASGYIRRGESLLAVAS